MLLLTDLTCLVESRALGPHLTGIVGRIHFHFEWTDGNFLIKANQKSILISDIRVNTIQKTLLQNSSVLLSMKTVFLPARQTAP